MAFPGHLEKKTEKFLNDLTKRNLKPLSELGPERARDFLNKLQANSSVELQPAQVSEIRISSSLVLTIIRPENWKDEILPVILYCHGGGWILGNEGTHEPLCRKLANGVQAAVVFINYTPSPEAQFSTIINQVHQAAEFIYNNGDKYNFDSDRIAIAGDSVGGNMATVVAMTNRNVKFIYQCLFYPVTDANFNTSSYQQFANGPWLTRDAMKWFWNAYEPDLRKRIDFQLSPLQADLGDLKKLPPTLLITDENDVLRDEGESYAHKLMQAGVEVTAVRFLGTIHDFMMLNPLSSTPATRGAIRLTIATLRDVFRS